MESPSINPFPRWHPRRRPAIKLSMKMMTTPMTMSSSHMKVIIPFWFISLNNLYAFMLSSDSCGIFRRDHSRRVFVSHFRGSHSFVLPTVTTAPKATPVFSQGKRSDKSSAPTGKVAVAKQRPGVSSTSQPSGDAKAPSLPSKGSKQAPSGGPPTKKVTPGVSGGDGGSGDDDSDKDDKQPPKKRKAVDKDGMFPSSSF